MASLLLLVYASLQIFLTSAEMVDELPKMIRPVRFRFTFRSFQPQICMTTEYFRMYCKSHNSTSLRYQQFQRNHCLPEPVMSGHPDFDPFYACKVFASDSPQQIVRPHLHYEESGLGKPVYCNNHTWASMNETGEGFLCGRSSVRQDGERHYHLTTGKDRFDEWYRDVPGVNKRVGLALTFYEYEDASLNSDIAIMGRRNESSLLTRYDSLDPVFNEREDGFFPLDDFTMDNGGASADPLKFQTVWPITSNWYEHKFSFTTEFHSVFTYFGGEVFQFTGDDDVYVFINGFLELDLGGRHSAMTEYIFLDSLKYSTLKVNETYTIDLFHAERARYESNFAIISTLVAPMAISDIGITGFDWPGSNEADFAFIGSLPTRGYTNNDSLVLLDTRSSSDMAEVGYVLLQRKLLVNNGFIIEIGVSITGTGSSGFTILLLNGDIANLPLTGRESRETEFDGVGVAQGEKSLGLTLDLCRNKRKPVLSTSTCEQEIRLHVNGQTESYIARSPIIGRLADNRVHTMVISYSAGTQFLEVFIDDSLYMLQTKFQASSYLGTEPTTVGISIYQDSIVPTASESFQDVAVKLHSFKVVVAEFRQNELFGTVDIIVITLVGFSMLLLICTTLRSDSKAIWRSLHSSVAFFEDGTAIFLLVEKACELCPGTPSTSLFLIFFCVEIVFQVVPHVTRRSPIFRFLTYTAIEVVQLFLFLNLLNDTVNTESAEIFMVCAGIQTFLVGFETINRMCFDKDKLTLNNVDSENVEDLKPTSTDVKPYSITDEPVFRRICNDCASTFALSALPLLTVFIYPRTSAFQEKWYQILVAQNMWYRTVVIDSMVESLSEEEYLNAGCIWNAEGRAQLREEWKEWAKKELTLAFISVGHTVCLHVFSANLAITHLESNPPGYEAASCYVTIMGIPYTLGYAYHVWRMTREHDDVIVAKSILDGKLQP